MVVAIAMMALMFGLLVWFIISCRMNSKKNTHMEEEEEDHDTITLKTSASSDFSLS